MEATRGRGRGQSEPLGFALLLGITIAGALVAAVLGGAALTDTQQTAEFDQAQQALTQFDSSASQVALGSTDIQSVAMSSGGGGTYSVAPNAGHVTIVHYNWSGPGTQHTVYESDLGAVVYQQNDRMVAYQGGGVWSSYGDGQGRVVSPPEFHYRGATLTFPIVRVTGSGGASGDSTAVVRQQTPTSVIYPNSSVTSPHTYENPQTKGSIVVEIESQYYEAWVAYFRQRTEGTVSVTPPATPGAPGVVTVELVSLGIGPGDFQMPGEGGAIELRGMGSDHALNTFNITVRPTDADSADFNDLQWSLYAESGGGQKQLEIHLRQNSGGDCDSVTADATVYYTEDGGDNYQSWVATDAFRGTCNADDDIVLVANLTNSSVDMTYQSISSNALLSTTPAKANGNFDTSGTFNSHASHTSEPLSSVSSKEMAFIVRHYVANMGSDVDLVVYDKNGNGGSVGEGQSSGTIQYGGTGQYVTFLHITENEIEVEFE